jgi:hypothetical protein
VLTSITNRRIFCCRWGSPEAAWTASGAEVTEPIVHRDVFGAWNTPGIREDIEAACQQYGPTAGWPLDYGALGGRNLDAFQLFSVLVNRADAGMEPTAAVDAVLSQLEMELRSPSISCTVYAPLFGVKLPAGKHVTLSHGIVLREATEDDWNVHHSRRDEPGSSHSFPSACLTMKFDQPRGSLDPNHDLRLRVDGSIKNAKRAMSIFRAGRIGSSFVAFSTPENRLFRFGSKSIRQGSITHGSYHLTEEDISALTVLADRLEKPLWND